VIGKKNQIETNYVIQLIINQIINNKIEKTNKGEKLKKQM
jgi:hypothetical protein